MKREVKMILILGGEASGKRTFARSLGYKDTDMTREITSPLPVFFQLEKVIRENPSIADDSLIEFLCQKQLVLCCEVGSGVIPVEREERVAREMIGRTCIRLAQRADIVIRMVAGIPTVIKGHLGTG